MGDSGFKTISYRGGIVTFAIPSHWCEEYNPTGGGTFYEDRPDSGTLGLNVLSFESKKTPEADVLRAFPDGSFEMLLSGFPLRYGVSEATEDNELLHIHTWKIAVPVPPQRMRIVIFSHTILASQESDPTIIGELALIRDSVRSATFSQESGVTGEYPQQ